MKSDEWFGSKEFLDALRQELVDLSFLPKPPARDGTIAFLPPSTARFLPKPFTKELEDVRSRPDVLFGDRIIGSRLLGPRARQCLERLKLLQELTAADLVAHWDTGAVSRWLDLLVGDARQRIVIDAEQDTAVEPLTDAQQKSLANLRQERLASILQALAELDDKNEWKEAKLRCLPTTSGDWTHRGAALGILPTGASWGKRTTFAMRWSRSLKPRNGS